MKNIYMLAVMLIFLQACTSYRTPLTLEDGDKVKIPMSKGNYGYVIADNYQITGYGWIDLTESEQYLSYPAVKRGNIFHVLKYDAERFNNSKPKFYDALARQKWICYHDDDCRTGKTKQDQQILIAELRKLFGEQNKKIDNLNRVLSKQLNVDGSGATNAEHNHKKLITELIDLFSDHNIKINNLSNVLENRLNMDDSNAEYVQQTLLAKLRVLFSEQNKKIDNLMYMVAEPQGGKSNAASGYSVRVLHAWKRHHEAIFDGIECVGDCLIDRGSVPDYKKISSEVPGDPPQGGAILGIVTTQDNIKTYQVKKNWSSGTIQYGFIYTKGDYVSVYETAYIAIYPSNYGFNTERFEWATPISINFGYTTKSRWNDYDTAPDDIDDSKVILGIGYSLASAKEIISLQAGRVNGRLDDKRFSEFYVGASLDILKAFDKFGN